MTRLTNPGPLKRESRTFFSPGTQQDSFIEFSISDRNWLVWISYASRKPISYYENVESEFLLINFPMLTTHILPEYFNGSSSESSGSDSIACNKWTYLALTPTISDNKKLQSLDGPVPAGGKWTVLRVWHQQQQPGNTGPGVMLSLEISRHRGHTQFLTVPPCPPLTHFTHFKTRYSGRVATAGGTGYWVWPWASRHCTAVLGPLYTHTSWTNSVWFESSAEEGLAQVNLNFVKILQKFEMKKVDKLLCKYWTQWQCKRWIWIYSWKW